VDVEKSREYDNWLLDMEKSKFDKWKNRKEYFTQGKRVHFDFDVNKKMKLYGIMKEYRFDSLKYAERYFNYVKYEIHCDSRIVYTDSMVYIIKEREKTMLDDSNSRIYKLNDAYYYISFFYDKFGKEFSDFLIKCDSLKWDLKWDLN
jgi:hypothetical protein